MRHTPKKKLVCATYTKKKKWWFEKKKTQFMPKKKNYATYAKKHDLGLFVQSSYAFLLPHWRSSIGSNPFALAEGNRVKTTVETVSRQENRHKKVWVHTTSISTHCEPARPPGGCTPFDLHIHATILEPLVTQRAQMDFGT